MAGLVFLQRRTGCHIAKRGLTAGTVSAYGEVRGLAVWRKSSATARAPHAPARRDAERVSPAMVWFWTDFAEGAFIIGLYVKAISSVCAE